VPWVAIVVLSVLCSCKPTGIELKIALPDFVVEAGEAMVVGSDSFAPPGDHVTLADGKSVPLPNTSRLARPLKVTNGVIRDVHFSRPGRYTALLSRLVVRRVSDNSRFRVPLSYVGEFGISQADLTAGTGGMPVQPGGIFRVIVLDSTGARIAGQEVSFSQVLSGRPIVFQAKSNADGEIDMLGRPEDFHIALVGNAESLKLEIGPL
jgi:hypothetical protein